MKLLISDCEKVWLFNAKTDRPFLKAGLACFLPGCKPEVTFTLNKQQLVACLPSKVVDATTSARMPNARLSLL